MSWGDLKRKLGINKARKRIRRELSSAADKVLGDELYTPIKRLGDELTETGRDITEQTEEFVYNPLTWANRTFMPDLFGDVVDTVKAETDALIGRGDEDVAAEAPAGQTMTMPDLAAARRRVAARKQRFGRASAILSDRPATPLGYTGGGSVANLILGG